MKNRCRFVKSESGQILVWVIGVLVLAALIIVPLLLSAFGGLRTSTIRQERMQELYAADTGIEDALNWIFNQGNLTRLNESGNATFPQIGGSFNYLLGFDTNNNIQIDDAELSNINGCNVSITGNRTADLAYTVTATGTNLDKGTHVKVQVKVTLEETTQSYEIEQPPVQIYPQSPSGGPFYYAIASLGDGEQFVGSAGGTIDGDIFINGNFNTSPPGGGATIVTGNLYCDGNMTLDLSSHVMGNASATGNIVLLSSSIIDGNAWANNAITINSSNGIGFGPGGGDAYSQTDVNVNDGSIVGSAWADHDVNVSDIIHQSAFANHDINVPGGTIDGWAYYLNNLNITGGGSVGNSMPLTDDAYVPPAVMPSVQENPDPGAVYLGNATSGGTYTPPSGTLTVSGTKSVSNLGLVSIGSGGPVYINGNLKFSNNAVLWLEGTVYVSGSVDMTANNCQVLAKPGTATPAVLVANGDITIKNNTVATPDVNMPLIMSVNGNIDCSNNDYVVGALYAPNGTITLMNNTRVDGAVVAKNIVTNNNYSVTYNPIVQNIPGLPGASGPGPLPTPYPSPVPPVVETIATPKGVHIDSYVVLEE